MSLFPYNNNLFVDYGAQGTPMSFKRALGLADTMFQWHSNHNTSDWTQSDDGAQADIRRIALGLMTVLPEPAVVELLIAVGRQTEGTINTLAKVRKMHGYQPPVENAENDALLGDPWEALKQSGIVI